MLHSDEEKEVLEKPKEHGHIGLLNQSTNQQLLNTTPVVLQINDEVKDGEESNVNLINNVQGTQSNPSANTSSKLDTLSKEDLIRIVKKQLFTINNVRKQMDVYKKEAEEKQKKINELAEKKPTENTDMIFMELNDYKKSLDSLKIQVKNAQNEMEAKDEAIKALSDNIEKLNEEKESYLLSLNQSNSELNKLKASLEDKTQVITENSKEINSLVVQISQLKSQMEAEIVSLNESNALQNKKLIEEQQREEAKSREIRRLKNEQELLQQKYDDLLQEYCIFKERAQFVLQQKSAEESDLVSMKKSSDEIQDLIDNLETKNEKISNLTSKCLFLEDNLHSVEQHLQTLQIELDSATESRINEQNLHQNERRTLISDYEFRIKELQDFIHYLKEEKRNLNEENLNEQLRIKTSLKEKMGKLYEQNKELREEVDKLKDEIRENNKRATVPEQIKTKNKLGLQLKLEEQNLTQNPAYNSNQYNSFEGAYTNTGEDEESNPDESLKSVIDQSFNGSLEIISSASDLTKCLDFSNPIDYRIQAENFEKQLSHTRDLLADTEETNLKLMEQVRILKDEIRRLERNIERQEHINNTEYFKNIMLKFLAPEQVSDERHQLLPVLRTMLRLSSEECGQIKKCIEITTQSQDTSINTIETINNSNKDWTGYFGSLSSIF